MNRGEVFLVRPRVLIAEERASYPLNLVTVFSSLKNINVNTHLVDIDSSYRQGALFSSICDDLLAKISPIKHPIVGISTNDASLPETLYLADKIKKRNKNCKIILGGPGVYSNSGAIISKFGHLVDYIVRGEAEQAFPALVTSILAGKESAHDRRVIDSPKVVRMDDYAFPQYDRLDPLPYRAKLGVDFIPVLVGAGCRHQCKYCSTSNFWGHRVRYKSVERVAKEILFLKSLGVSKIEFVHDNLFSDMAYVVRLSEVLLREEAKISWACSGRADDFDIAAAPLMAKAGCRSIFWGLESGSEDGLRIINKKMPLESSVGKICEVAKKHQIYSKISFIYNFPGDNLDCFKQTLALAFRLKSEYPEKIQVALNNYLALSGTIFTKSTSMPRSQYLVRQIDFDPVFRKKVMEDPALFTFFSRPRNVTTLTESFRFTKINPILNTFPKTLGFLLEKYELIDILRNLQKHSDLKEGVDAMWKKGKIAQHQLAEDVFLFEYLSALPPACAEAKKTYRLLETKYNLSTVSSKPGRKKSRYLFYYHDDKIDTFQITLSNFRRFRKAAQRGLRGEREVIGEIEKHL